MNLVEDYLANADLRSAPAALRSVRPTSTVLLTSRGETSRYAVLLLCDRASTPRLVAKVVRRPGHQERLSSEFDMLRLAARLDDGRGAPLPLALTQHRGHWLLIETALAGVPLNRHRLRKHPLRAWQLVDDWLRLLAELAAEGSQQGTQAASREPMSREPAPAVPFQRAAPAVPKVDERWCDQQVGVQLRLMADALPATEPERNLFDTTTERILELIAGDVPTPAEHGDFFPANLLVSRSGQHLAAVDWELGRPVGLAGADAAVFLSGLLHSLDGSQRVSRTASYARHFLAADGLGRRLLSGHLERHGVDPRWLDHVLLATWVRRALQIWLPVVLDDAPGGNPATGRERFRSFWAPQLWRMTLERLSS